MGISWLRSGQKSKTGQRRPSRKTATIPDLHRGSKHNPSKRRSPNRFTATKDTYRMRKKSILKTPNSLISLRRGFLPSASQSRNNPKRITTPNTPKFFPQLRTALAVRRKMLQMELNPCKSLRTPAKIPRKRTRPGHLLLLPTLGSLTRVWLVMEETWLLLSSSWNQPRTLPFSMKFLTPVISRTISLIVKLLRFLRTFIRSYQIPPMRFREGPEVGKQPVTGLLLKAKSLLKALESSPEPRPRSSQWSVTRPNNLMRSILRRRK